MSEPGLFHGDLITLRAFEPNDVEALYGYLNQPDLADRRYVPDRFAVQFPLSRAEVQAIYEEWIGVERGRAFAVVLKGTGALVGHAEIEWGWDPRTPSLSVVIATGHRRHGCGAEAARILTRYLFEHTPAHLVQAGFASFNEQARGFAKTLGFTEDGALRRVGLRDGQPFDWVVVTLLRREWQGGDHAAEG